MEDAENDAHQRCIIIFELHYRTLFFQKLLESSETGSKHVRKDWRCKSKEFARHSECRSGIAISILTFENHISLWIELRNAVSFTCMIIRFFEVPLQP